MLKIAICDDEPYIRSYLASLVRKQDPEAAVREYASASDYLSDGTDPDLLFLDIELKEPDPNGGKRPPQASAPDTACQAAPPSDSQRMPPSDWTPCENGMELARRIRAAKEGPQPLIIFVTGHEAYVYDAFDVNAFQYLLKPIEEPRFAEIFRRAADQIRAKKELQRKNLSSNTPAPARSSLWTVSIIWKAAGTRLYCTKKTPPWNTMPDWAIWNRRCRNSSAAYTKVS